jgi:hypothetical protein
MRRHIIALLLLAFTTMTAQEAGVEKSIYNIQAGSFGVWINNESRLGNQFALRTEAGLDVGLLMGGLYDEFNFLMAPVITVEPRWYYNLASRSAKSKIILGNSGSFVSLKTSYHPDWFVISSNETINIPNQISVIPTWGIRRQVGQHFNYEAGFGVGYLHVFDQADNAADDSGATVNIHFRLGYRF